MKKNITVAVLIILVLVGIFYFYKYINPKVSLNLSDASTDKFQDMSIPKLSPADNRLVQSHISKAISLSSLLNGNKAKVVNVGNKVFTDTSDPVLIAKERKVLLLELAKKSPILFLSVAMPAAQRANLPAAVQQEIEKDVTLTGSLQTLQVDDFSNPENTHFEYYLTSKKERYELYPTATIPLSANTPVSVSGFVLDSAVVAKTNSIQAVAPAPKPESLGVQKTAILLVDFLDSGLKPFTPAYIKDYIFKGQFEKFYEEQSYGKTSFIGDVFGWFTLPRNAGAVVCGGVDQNDIANIIKSNNINLANYDRLVIIPAGPNQIGGCSFVGKSDQILNNITYHISISWVGGDRFDEPSLWGNQPFKWSNLDYLMAHELGHALGVMHANGWDCEDRSLYGNCNHREYGNLFDTMGTMSYSLQFNALYKELLGWIVPTRIKTLSPGITTNLYPLESTKDVVLLKVPTTPNSTDTSYYIEYRQGMGFDLNLNNADLVSNKNGIFINRKDNSFGVIFPRLLDASPTSKDWYDDLKQVTLNNSTFVDSGRGISIQSFPLSQPGSPTSALPVKVTYQKPQCLNFAPNVGDIYSPARWVPVPGGNYTYLSVAFFNGDSLACGSTTFNSQLTIPSPLTGSGDETVTIYPEETGYYNNSIYIPEGTPGGQYLLKYTLTNSQTGLSTSIDVPIQVEPPANQPPKITSVPPVPPSISAGKLYPFTFSASDPDNDDLSWSIDWGDGGTSTKGEFCSTGPLQGTGQNWSKSLSHGWAKAGSYLVNVLVSDCKGGTDQTSFTVNIGSMPISDVPVSDPSYTAIRTIVDQGIMSLDGNGAFNPNDNLTRAQAAVTMVRRFNISMSNLPTTPTFADVPASSIYWPFVEAIYRAGLTTGCSSSPLSFCPDSLITRGQYAIFLVRGWGLDPTTASTIPYFSDLDSSHYAFPFVQRLYEAGSALGCGVNPPIFCPDKNITRRDTAMMLYSTMGGGGVGLAPNSFKILGAEAFHFTQLLKH